MEEINPLDRVLIDLFKMLNDMTDEQKIEYLVDKGYSLEMATEVVKEFENIDKEILNL